MMLTLRMSYGVRLRGAVRGVRPARASGVGRIAFGWAAEGKGADHNLLQKIRSRVKLGRMNNPALPHGLLLGRLPFPGTIAMEKREEKFFRGKSS